MGYRWLHKKGRGTLAGGRVVKYAPPKKKVPVKALCRHSRILSPPSDFDAIFFFFFGRNLLLTSARAKGSTVHARSRF